MRLKLTRRLVRVILIPGLAAILYILLPLPGTSRLALSQQQPNNIADSETVPEFLDTPIGAVESYYRPDDAVEAGVGFERIIFEWRYLQPNGPDDWYENYIPAQWLSDAKQGKRRVIGLLKNAPAWATGSTMLGATPRGLNLPIDDPNKYWAAFVKKLVLYYGPKWNIHDWIIYNEPDIRPENTQYFEFAGSVRDYYNVVKVAYKAAHAADPQVLIHLAGLTYWQDVTYNRNYYLERFLRTAYADPEGRKNNLFFDVLSVHIFQSTDNVWYITQLFKHLPETLGFSKPVWIDEMNALINNDGDWPVTSGYAPVSLDQQASFIIQGTALALAAGAERVQVYRMFDNDVHPGYEAWGLVRGDGTRRPGYYALKTASEYFRNSSKVERIRNNFATMVVFTQPDRTVYVVWNRTLRAPIYVQFPVDIELDSETQVRTVSQIGEESALSPNNVKALLPDNASSVQAADGSYKLLLPPCISDCEIEGEPRIVVQAGPPRPVTILTEVGETLPLTSINADQADQLAQP